MYDDDDELGEGWEVDWDEEGVDPWDDDAAAETFACDECGAELHEYVEMCPVCGHWVERRSKLEGKPTWYLLLGVLGVIAVLVVVSGLM